MRHIFSTISFLLIATSIAILLTSCGFQGTIKDRGSEPSSSPILLSDYTYRVVGSCDNNTVLFKVLRVDGIILGEAPDHLKVGTLELYLFDDSRYVVRYWEYDPQTETNSTVQQFQGTFVADSRRIAMSGLGSAIQFESGNRFGLAVTFTRDIISAGLSGHEYFTRSVFVKEGLERFEDVCPSAAAAQAL